MYTLNSHQHDDLYIIVTVGAASYVMVTYRNEVTRVLVGDPALRVGCSHRLTIARIIVCNACHELRMILLVYHYSLMVYIQYHRRVTYHHCNTIEYR